MKRVLLAGVLFSLVSWIGAAQGLDLSGSWSSRLTLLGGEPLPESSFTLDLRSPGWELVTAWSLTGGQLVGQTIELSSSLGALNLAVGASFKLEGGSWLTDDGSLLWEGLTLERGYLSLELELYNLRLKLTVVGSPGPGK